MDAIKLSEQYTTQNFAEDYGPSRDARIELHKRDYKKVDMSNSFMQPYCSINRLNNVLYEENENKSFNMCVSGGQLCAAYFNKSWLSDLDIYCTFSSFKNLDMRYGVPDFLPWGYEKKIIYGTLYPPLIDLLSDDDDDIENDIQDGSYSTSDNPMIRCIIDFTNHKTGYKVQFIIMPDCISIFDMLDAFDLDICKIFYDGTGFYAHKSVDKPICEVDDKYIISERGDVVLGRIEKYRSRGFKIRCCLDIVDEEKEKPTPFQTSFTETMFSNLVLNCNGDKFYVDAGYMMRHCKLLQNLWSSSVTEKEVLQINVPKSIKSAHLELILKWLYDPTCNKTNLRTTNMWDWITFGEYFQCTTVQERISVKYKELTKNGFEPKHVIYAHTYRLPHYSELIRSIIKKKQYRTEEMLDQYPKEILKDIILSM